MTRAPRPLWTAEEDEIIRTAPPKFTIEDLQAAIKERTGMERSHKAVRLRRKRINPDYNIEPAGFIRLVAVANNGINGDKLSHEALREAKAAGVLRVTRINGRDVRVVPMKWADEWLAKKEKHAAEYQHAIDNNWLPTSVIWKGLNQTRDVFWAWMRKARESRSGILVPLADVPRVEVNPIYGDQLWEPIATRVAIAKVRELEGMNRKLRRHYWGSKRVAAFFNLDSYHTLDTNPTFRAVHDLNVQRNTRGWRYWNPDEVRAWAKANGVRTEEDE